MAKQERFYINVFNGCNLSCSHCFNDGGFAEEAILTTPEILCLVDEAVDILKITEIQLTGGEPLQRSDIFPLIKELQDRGLAVILQTNGFFGQEPAKKISQLAREGLSLIVSIDGIETNDLFRGKGVTSKALENVKTLSNETEIRINTLLSSSIRWKEIEELAELGEKFSIVLAFNPVCPLGRADFSLMMEPHKYFRWMYRLEGLRNRGIQVRKCFDLIGGRLMERENCPVRKGATIHIAADGKAYPCGFLVNRPECLIGSYRGESLQNLMGKIPAGCRLLHPDCQICDYHLREECWGGCPARILGLNGRFGEKDLYCMASCLPSKGDLEDEP
ncbi:radical SAM/SPASM domain-containing protein [Methanothrix sp.]|jgi:radical SAM protein with 4Fe4S-binding SPASM domain